MNHMDSQKCFAIYCSVYANVCCLFIEQLCMCVSWFTGPNPMADRAQLDIKSGYLPLDVFTLYCIHSVPWRGVGWPHWANYILPSDPHGSNWVWRLVPLSGWFIAMTSLPHGGIARPSCPAHEICTEWKDWSFPQNVLVLCRQILIYSLCFFSLYETMWKFMINTFWKIGWCKAETKTLPTHSNTIFPFF